jgi:hypothetical protein
MSEELTKITNQMLRSLEKPSPEVLYNQLGRLRNEMPDYSRIGKPGSTKWMGSIIAVIEATEYSMIEVVKLRMYFENATRYGCDPATAIMIAQAIDTVLAKLEFKVPGEMQGAFIPAGGQHDGYQAVAKAVAMANKSVFFVDPYGDHQLISDFVSLAPEGLPVYVLSDEKYVQPNLKPAALNWIAQWKEKRPLQVRITGTRILHDRLVITDSSTAWVLGQSFKDLAKRAHSSLVKMDPDSAKLKIGAHIELWDAATPVS